jgi:hypothetical protein
MRIRENLAPGVMVCPLLARPFDSVRAAADRPLFDDKVFSPTVGDQTWPLDLARAATNCEASRMP